MAIKTIAELRNQAAQIRNENTDGANTAERIGGSLGDVVDTFESAKQDKLIAGTNITIAGNVISATGGGGSEDPYAFLRLKREDSTSEVILSAPRDTGGAGMTAFNQGETENAWMRFLYNNGYVSAVDIGMRGEGMDDEPSISLRVSLTDLTWKGNRVATENYVDGLIGDINAALDSINRTVV